MFTVHKVINNHIDYTLDSPVAFVLMLISMYYILETHLMSFIRQLFLYAYFNKLDCNIVKRNHTKIQYWSIYNSVHFLKRNIMINSFILIHPFNIIESSFEHFITNWNDNLIPLEHCINHKKHKNNCLHSPTVHIVHLLSSWLEFDFILTWIWLLVRL